jgi:AcrR family transcriptional regulator
MGKVQVLPVDADQRKRTIAIKATQIIAHEGLHAATIRRIAAELNSSTRVVTHYFADKDELLDWVYEFMAAEGFNSFAERLALDPSDVLGCLLTMTPFDPLNRDLWRVYIAFWNLAARDPNVADKLQTSIQEAEQLVASAIAVRNPGHPNCVESARQLIALVNGISVQLLLEPKAWEQERAREILERNIDVILGPPAG